MLKKNLLKADKYFLVTFPTTHNALHAEKVLDEFEITFLVVPTPRELSAGCGLSIRFFEESYPDLRQRFDDGSVVFSSIYDVTGGRFKAIVSPVSRK